MLSIGKKKNTSERPTQQFYGQFFLLLSIVLRYKDTLKNDIRKTHKNIR